MPFVTMIAGPNGSGKSTLTQKLTNGGLNFGEYLNADDIAAALRGPLEEVSLKAQAEVRKRREAAVREGRDHSFETVMSHPSHIDHLRTAKIVGFEVLIYFVATEDPWINEQRVANRVLHGGHDVPRERIAARYHRCLANLSSAIAVADGGLIFDNSSAVEPMVALAEIREGGLRHLVAGSARPRWWSNVLADMAR